MYRKLDDFLGDWQRESNNTVRLLQTLTDTSLSQPVGDGLRTLGRIAWHITTTIPEMMNQTGLRITKVEKDDPVPPSADLIRKAYDMVSKELLTKVKAEWNDELLLREDTMYGMQWKRGTTLFVLLNHQSHHRGQMTVLMRQAGLPVLGLVGPSREEWAGMNMTPPVV